MRDLFGGMLLSTERMNSELGLFSGGMSQSLFWWNVVVYTIAKKIFGQKFDMSQSLFWWNVVVYKVLMKCEECFCRVAILVLVECCCLRHTFQRWFILAKKGRNPCFGGMLLSTYRKEVKDEKSNVAILVLVECCCLLKSFKKRLRPVMCRNPCFGGMLLSTIKDETGKMRIS